MKKGLIAAATALAFVFGSTSAMAAPMKKPAHAVTKKKVAKKPAKKAPAKKKVMHHR